MRFISSERMGRLCGGRFMNVFAMVLLSFVFITPFVLGEDAPSGTDKGEETKEGDNIHFRADSLAADNESIELIGNVRMEQGNSVITADRIKIFFEETKEEKEENAEKTRSFDRAVASGNVRIRFEGEEAESDKDVYTAEAERAEYRTADQVLILSGGKPIVRQGASYLSGPEIIYNRAEQRLRVNGSGNERVEGEIIQSGFAL